MDDELFDELHSLYRRARDDHDDELDDDALASVIMWDLRRCEVLDLAGDALDDDLNGVAPTQHLARRRLHELIHAFRNYYPDD